MLTSWFGAVSSHGIPTCNLAKCKVYSQLILHRNYMNIERGRWHLRNKIWNQNVVKYDPSTGSDVTEQCMMGHWLARAGRGWFLQLSVPDLGTRQTGRPTVTTYPAYLDKFYPWTSQTKQPNTPLPPTEWRINISNIFRLCLTFWAFRWVFHWIFWST